MKTLITTGAVALALFTAALAPSAKADDWNRKTVITVQGGAVQIQGKVLEPGKYVLKLHDSPADRRIVQVFNADQTKLETTVFADAAYRVKPADRTAFTFYEMPGAQPPAIHTWFYPGENYGLAFSR
ncbi:MAG TPA: hypothetical protein VMF91_26570 [Bryobacteraceae bacterium]|nr:hypothetical protein [Bryobacteraceae bacterium]